MIRIGPISSIFDYATFFLMLYFFKCKLYSSAETSPAMKTYYESLFHTGWFVESILTQTLIVHIIRTPRIPFFQSIASPFLLFTTALVMIVGAVLPYSPFADYFGFVPLPNLLAVMLASFAMRA
jgi:Mg2+-importing ATPase